MPYPEAESVFRWVKADRLLRLKPPPPRANAPLKQESVGRYLTDHQHVLPLPRVCPQAERFLYPPHSPWWYSVLPRHQRRGRVFG